MQLRDPKRVCTLAVSSSVLQSIISLHKIHPFVCLRIHMAAYAKLKMMRVHLSPIRIIRIHVPSNRRYDVSNQPASSLTLDQSHRQLTVIFTSRNFHSCVPSSNHHEFTILQGCSSEKTSYETFRGFEWLTPQKKSLQPSASRSLKCFH